MSDDRPICTKDNPAPAKDGQSAWAMTSWNWNWRHPDAVHKDIVNSDHGDVRVRCPHCGQTHVQEGPDA